MPQSNIYDLNDFNWDSRLVPKFDLVPAVNRYSTRLSGPRNHERWVIYAGLWLSSDCSTTKFVPPDQTREIRDPRLE